MRQYICSSTAALGNDDRHSWTARYRFQHRKNRVGTSLKNKQHHRDTMRFTWKTKEQGWGVLSNPNLSKDWTSCYEKWKTIKLQLPRLSCFPVALVGRVGCAEAILLWSLIVHESTFCEKTKALMFPLFLSLIFFYFFSNTPLFTSCFTFDLRWLNTYLWAEKP